MHSVTDLSLRALEALSHVVDAKEGGARRPGQETMVQAVASAIDDQHHLLVEAGPGTGKSFGYLIPALASGKRVVVSTATKSLQDQLSERDLPFLEQALAPHDIRFTWATVKGRASYLCMSRLEEMIEDTKGGATLFGETAGLPEHLGTLIDWAATDPSGDRDDLPEVIPDDVWAKMSVSGTECPGRDQCPQAGSCYAMAALDRAASADIVVVNHHLYGAHLVANGSILPEHDVVIFDEGHRLEDTMASSFGLEITAGRLWQVHRASAWLKGVLPPNDVTPVLDGLQRRAKELGAELDRTPVGRLRDVSSTQLGHALARAASDVAELTRMARKSRPDRPGHSGARARLLRLAGHLAADAELAMKPPEHYVAWVEWAGRTKAYQLAPVQVGDLIADRILGETVAIVTSATLSVGGRLRPLARSLGLRWQVAIDGVQDVADPAPDDEHDLSYHAVRVASPFDHEAQGRVYVAAHLPDPRSEKWEPAALDEIETLVSASGGRALVLATSHRMVRSIKERLAKVLDVTVLAQGDLPKRQLIDAFETDETSVLVATLGFWEGLDIPGRSLQLVIMDKLPFPRPDDPLWVARREAAEGAGLSAFQVVDLPRAAMLMAQGAGRLIRTTTDHGVVALLDSRLAYEELRPDPAGQLAADADHRRSSDRRVVPPPALTAGRHDGLGLAVPRIHG